MTKQAELKIFSPREIQELIKLKQLIKPKYQRKKKWSIFFKKKTIPNIKDYIKFLYINTFSFDIITLSSQIKNNKQIYINIDGNNRINAICHFLNNPLKIFPEYLEKFLKFSKSKLKNEEEVKKIKEYMEKLNYCDIINFSWSKNFKNFDEDLYKNKLGNGDLIRDDGEEYIDNIKNNLKIGNLRFDDIVRIPVAICKNYKISDLIKIFVDINEANTSMTPIEIYAGVLYNACNFTIENKDIYHSILSNITEFYKNNSIGEELECYKIDKDKEFQLNAYDFLVGYQNYCSKKCININKIDNDKKNILFTLWEILFNSVDGETFTNENVNEFIENIEFCIECFKKIKNKIFINNRQKDNYFQKLEKNLNQYKDYNLLFIFSTLIGIKNNNKNDKKNCKKILSICIPILYNFFVKGVTDKTDRDKFNAHNIFKTDGGGSYISNKCKTFLKNPEVFFKNKNKPFITRPIFKQLTKYLLNDFICPDKRFLENGSIKKNKRRDRKFLEKYILYNNCAIKNSMIEITHNIFSNEHIFPFSSKWDGEIDIERLGNIFPLPIKTNIRRSNKHIKEYKNLLKEENHNSNFLSNLQNIIPNDDDYNKIIKHNGNKCCKIFNNIEFNKYCKKNEQEYIQVFLDTFSFS